MVTGIGWDFCDVLCRAKTQWSLWIPPNLKCFCEKYLKKNQRKIHHFQSGTFSKQHMQAARPSLHQAAAGLRMHQLPRTSVPNCFKTYSGNHPCLWNNVAKITDVSLPGQGFLHFPVRRLLLLTDPAWIMRVFSGAFPENTRIQDAAQELQVIVANLHVWGWGVEFICPVL